MDKLKVAAESLATFLNNNEVMSPTLVTRERKTAGLGKVWLKVRATLDALSVYNQEESQRSKDLEVYHNDMNPYNLSMSRAEELMMPPVSPKLQ